jgi:protein O-mannosyl-transferase
MKKKRRTESAAITERTHWWKGRHFPALLFLGVSILLSYSSSFHGTWALDDSSIGQFTSIEKVIDQRHGYRIVALLSFAINGWINPLDPFNYRILNIIIHFINSALVYLIVLRTLKLPGIADRYGVYAFPAALVSAAIFALHPININAVAYIIQRMTSLSAMFVLLSLQSYISARLSVSRFKSVVFYLLSLSCLILGALSKENAIMGVPLILLYDYVFIMKFQTGRLNMRQLAAGIAGILLLVITAVLLNLERAASILGMFLKLNQPIEGSGWTAVDIYWTPLQHILTEFRVIGRYFFLLLFPLPEFLVFDWWGFPVSKSLTEPVTTLISVLLVLSAVIFSWHTRKKRPFLFFGVLWYFIAISLESFIVPGLDLYFEHRNYLPFAGLAIGFTTEFMCLFRGRTLDGKALWAGVLLISVLLGSLTFQRNQMWRDSVTLWEDTVAKDPENVRAIIALGNSYLKKPDIDAAINYFEKAVNSSLIHKRGRFFEDSAYSLGMTSLFIGDTDRAGKIIETMESSLEDAGPQGYRSKILKAYYQNQLGNPETAITGYESVLNDTLGLDRVIVHTLLGDAYRKAGRLAEALEKYDEALEIDPHFSAAFYGMAQTYLSMRNPDQAKVYLQKALDFDPSNPLALSDMSDIMLIRKEPMDRVMYYAEMGVYHASGFYQPYLSMGNALIVGGRDSEAEEFYLKAKQRGLEEYMVPFSKARAYYIKGDHKKASELLEISMGMKDFPDELKKTIRQNKVQ